MTFLKVLLAAALLLPVAACGGVTITQPQYANTSQMAQRVQYTPLVLECGNRYDTAHAVSLLTLAQLNDPDKAVRFTGGLPRTCRSSNITATGIFQGSHTVATRDGWRVEVIDWVQSNGFPVTYVDTSQAYLGQPARRRYEQAVPRRYDNTHAPPQRRHDGRRKMTVEEGQDFLRQELRRLKK